MSPRSDQPTDHINLNFLKMQRENNYDSGRINKSSDGEKVVLESKGKSNHQTTYLNSKNESLGNYQQKHDKLSVSKNEENSKLGVQSSDRQSQHSAS